MTNLQKTHEEVMINKLMFGIWSTESEVSHVPTLARLRRNGRTLAFIDLGEKLWCVLDRDQTDNLLIVDWICSNSSGDTHHHC